MSPTTFRRGLRCVELFVWLFVDGQLLRHVQYAVEFVVAEQDVSEVKAAQYGSASNCIFLSFVTYAYRST